jgi:hypothetical protein
MVREGLADVHQLKPFAPLYVRKHQSTSDAAGELGGAARAGETGQ